MYERLLKNNIDKLNLYLTKGLFLIKNIDLDNEESSIITEIIKSNWNDLYNKNYLPTFNYLKDKLKKETYDKVLNLYLDLFYR